MNPFLKSNRENIDIWVAIGLTFSLIVYNLSMNLTEQIQIFFQRYTSLPIATLFTNFMFFWTLSLLWVAYRRWRHMLSREAVFSDILSSTGPEVVMVVDINRKIQLCNESVKWTFGYEVEEVINKSTSFLYEDRRIKRNTHEIKEALDRVGFHIGEAIGIKKDGREVNLEIITALLKGRSDAVLMLQDISERKRAENNLRTARDEAEAANKTKDQLLNKLDENYLKLKELESLRDSLMHMIVHDMKTPLQILLLKIDLLLCSAENRLECLEKESLESMASHTRQLDVMIKSVLDVSRLEEGKLPLNLEYHKLGDTVREAIQYLGSLSQNHQLEINEEPSLNLLLYDAEVIHRVIVNLLVNAIKFTPEKGEICVTISQDSKKIKLSIQDTGPGIPKEDQSKIFEKFGQVQREERKHKGSSGLGLSFCKLAMEAHEGAIGVFSELGKGSTFWFTLPSNISTSSSQTTSIEEDFSAQLKTTEHPCLTKQV